jgi:uncharacterized protein YbaP (TraB family)
MRKIPGAGSGPHKTSAFVAAFVLCLAWTIFLSPAKGISAESDRGCLWSLQTDQNTIYLLGSMHLFKKESYPMPVAVQKAYADSPILVFETDMEKMADPAVQAMFVTMGMYPPGKSLFQDLPEETGDMLREKLEETGIPPEQFSRFKPWLCALTLTMTELVRLGFDPSYGIDNHFFRKAAGDDREILFFESFEDHLRLLSEMDEGEQASFLTQTLKDLEIVDEMALRLLASWREGNVSALADIFFRSFQDHPDIRDRLLTERNRQWADKIQELAEQPENVLVVVGVGHLIGDQSLVEFLRESGFEVNRK